MALPEPTADQLRRQPLPLRGRVALVTGVSRHVGIGYAIARRLAGLGAWSWTSPPHRDRVPSTATTPGRVCPALPTGTR